MGAGDPLRALTGAGRFWQAPRPMLSPEQARVRGLLEQHTPALQIVALKLCRNRADAGDLVQDTLERALRREDQIAGVHNLHAWLATILHRMFLDRCRAGQRRPQVAIDDVTLAAPEPTPPPLWASISQQDLHGAVARLDPNFRAVFELHARDGASYADIADRLGIPKNTVGTRLARARLKLRELLTGAAAEAEKERA